MNIWTQESTAEVVESPPGCWVARNRRTFEYVVVDDHGRIYFDTREEIEAALKADGWALVLGDPTDEKSP